MLRFALVGAGSIGKKHASCIRSIEGASIEAVVDTDLEAARALAGGEAKAFATLDEALASGGIDAVDVCTPTPVHAPIAIAALEAGKHLLLEKPMARTLDECDAIIAAAQRAPGVAMVAHVLRFFPEYAAARDAVLAGKAGKPAVVRTSRGGKFPRGESSWYADIDQSGGVALDLIVHDFDWLLWCLGPATRVFARGMAPGRPRGQDYALVTINFASGCIAHVEGTWMRPSGFETWFEIAGDGGLIDYSSRDSASLEVAVRAAPGEGEAVQIPESPLAESPYLAEIRHFVECASTGQQPSITLQEARDAARIALAALESMDTGQPVTIA